MAPSQKQQQQQVNLTPCLRSFLENIKFNSTEKNTQQLIALIRRHQITHPHAIALATTYLLRSVVNKYNESAAGQSLFDTVKAVGNTLCKALEREMIVGNITRRVLTVVKEETEGKKESHAITDVPLASATTALASVVDTAVIPNARPASQDHALADALERTSLRGPGVPAQAPPIISMFHVLAEEEMAQSIETTKKEGQEVKQEDKKEGKEDDKEKEVPKPKDVRVDVIDGINEIIDELEQVDDQIAAYAPEHIHSNEVILTYGASRSVQRFLMRAGAKRKFTVLHAESYPNHHLDTHAYATGTPALETLSNDVITPEAFQKSLADYGVTVILIPDSAVYALMARVNKVILGTHSVMANGGLLADAGTRLVASTAKLHMTPVVVVTGIYTVSPVYPFDPSSYIEYGDPSKYIEYEDAELMDKVEVENPLQDYVPPELIDLFISNIGGFPPSYLYRIVGDYYTQEVIL